MGAAKLPSAVMPTNGGGTKYGTARRMEFCIDHIALLHFKFTMLTKNNPMDSSRS
jgi:hypothetical protein